MKRIWLLLIAVFLVHSIDARKIKSKKKILKQVREQIMETKVHKKVLKNGLTVLVYPSHRVPKVMVSMWYNVGSKDEKDAEKGIAHFIEHMIFKGNGTTITEQDIPMFAHKLSASTNAATSYDYTNYYFYIPTHHWKEVFPVFADIMQHTAFNDQHINSEMKAVIQELKMNRDNYVRSVFSSLVSALFPDHPYHYPVIGFKQDLWHMHSKNLKDFYKKHYIPNNATLVITGDVDPEEVFDEAKKYLQHIHPNKEYKKESFYTNHDLASKAVTIYRDVQHPIALLAFIVPGAQDKLSEYFDVLSLMLGNLKSSRLHKKLVDEMRLATMVGVGDMDLFEHGVLYIIFQPSEGVSIQDIEAVIIEELQAIAACGPNKAELQKAIKQARKQYYDLFENIDEQAQKIGKYYLATGDEAYVFNYLLHSPEEIGKKIQELVCSYMRPSIMHKAIVLPLPEEEKKQWRLLQQQSDEEDTRFLSARERTESLQKPVYTEKLKVSEPQQFNFPKAEIDTLSNGIKVFSHHNDTTPKIDIVIEFKAKHYYDAQDEQGLYNFMTSMLDEGTKKYTAAELAELLDAHAITIAFSPGGMIISLLKEDLEKGLELALELLTNATFPKENIEKVRAQLLVEIKNFWDDPKRCVRQLVKDALYKGHPWSKNQLGTAQSIQGVTQKDLIKAYKKYISPDGAKIAIVGNIKDSNIKKVLEKTIGKWTGPAVEAIQYPSLQSIRAQNIDHAMNRDQIVLAFAGLSVDRLHPDYEKLLLFDQIFGMGALGSLHSRLFSLREETGLFYTINGSTIAGTGEQPGMVNVTTIVSLDRLKEAEKAIKLTIDTVAETITEQELKEARYAVVNALVNNFGSNYETANAFLFLDKYNLPNDFFDKRNQTLSLVSLQDVIETAKKYLNTNNMITVRAGRI